MKIDETFVSVAPTSSYKGYCVYAKVGREMYPIIYFKRPKPIAMASFQDIVEAIEVKLSDGFEFELEPEKTEVKAPVRVVKK